MRKIICHRFENDSTLNYVELPPQSRTISYLGCKYNINLPYVFLGTEVDRKDFTVTYWGYCAVEPFPCKLYGLPLPNLSHGNICMGNVKIKTFKDFVEGFWRARFNGDRLSDYKVFAAANNIAYLSSWGKLDAMKAKYTTAPQFTKLLTEYLKSNNLFERCAYGR